MRLRKRSPLFFVGLLIFIALLSSVPANAQSQEDSLLKYWSQGLGPLPPLSDVLRYSYKVQAKATIDECFYGLDPAADPVSPLWKQSFATFLSAYPNDFNSQQISNCLTTGGHTKVNQAYVWGLTQNTAGNELWFGTVANTLCLVFDGFYQGFIPPNQTTSWECAMRSTSRPYGDARPPRVYVYNTLTRTLTDKTPDMLVTLPDASRKLDPNLSTTLGLRSAGSSGGVIFLGGVGFGAVNVFAFDEVSKAYLGSYTFDGKNGRLGPFTNIRQWITYNGELYTGVATASGGKILHWTGNLGNPFQFEIVGDLAGDPAYLAIHNGRMYASTWGGPSSSGGMILYMSPAFTTKLAPTDAPSWTPVWQLSNYEVEPAAPQVAGAIASFDGWLYFSTMHVPATGLVAFYSIYKQTPDTTAFLGTYRPIVIFRGRNFGTPTQEVQLLYGNAQLPKYDPVNSQWTLVPNRMGQKPLYGTAGFNNFFNNYTWWMQVYKGELFVGTMDWSYLSNGLGAGLGDGMIPSAITQLAKVEYGADLMRFHSSSEPAYPVNIWGVGNKLNYGIRTMIVSGNDLYLGSANPMNLETTPDAKKGGWELIKFTRLF